MVKKGHGESQLLHKGRPVVLLPFGDQVWYRLFPTRILIRRIEHTDCIVMDSLPENFDEIKT